MALAEVIRSSEYGEKDRPAFQFGEYNPRALSNEVVEGWGIVDFDGKPITAEYISTKMGIEERGISSENESTSFMAKMAAKGLTRFGDHLDSVIFSSSIPVGYNQADRLVKDLGITAGHTVEVGVACSGFTEALSLAYKNPERFGKDIFISSSELYSKYCADLREMPASEDRALSQLIFGDAARDVRINLNRLELLSQHEELIPSDDILMPIGIPHNEGNYHTINITKSPDHFRQNGRAVIRAVAKYVPPVVEAVMEKANLNPEKVKLVVPHQPSRPTLEALSRESSQFTYLANFRRRGNLSSASIPDTLMESMRGKIEGAYKAGKPAERQDLTVRQGDTIIMVGFGAGFRVNALAATIH